MGSEGGAPSAFRGSPKAEFVIYTKQSISHVMSHINVLNMRNSQSACYINTYRHQGKCTPSSPWIYHCARVYGSNLSLCQVQRNSNFVSAKSGQVIMRHEVLLQFTDLLFGERRSLFARFCRRRRCLQASPKLVAFRLLRLVTRLQVFSTPTYAAT